MKAHHYLLVGWTIWSALTACRPDPDIAVPDPGKLPINQTDFIRPKGTPDGPLVQKTIGPEGGTLASADSRLTMVIPAGAVKQATPFSIQPITNTLADSVGNAASAYRLLPEGTTFEKPVTLQMRYESADLTNTSSQALFLAYQGSDGIWKYLPSTELDEKNKTLTVETHHFSDWGVFAEFYLLAATTHLKPGESTRLMLRATNLTESFDDATTSTEVLISKVRTLSNPNNIQNWKASAGELAVEPSKLNATYTAPATVPGEGLSVQVTVDITNFIPLSRVKRKGATGYAIMVATLIVEGDAYFHLFTSLGGEDSPVDVTYGAFIPTNGEGTITATLAGGDALVLLIYADQNDYVRSYPYYLSQRDDTPRHKAEIGLKNFSKNWVATYQGCKANGEFDPHVSPGTVEITGHEQKDGRNYLMGHFRATVYSEKGHCGKGYSREQQTIHGDFKVPFLK